MTAYVRRLPLLPKALLALLAAALLTAAAAFAWWTISPRFTNVTVAEGLERSPESRVLATGSFEGADAFHQVAGAVLVIEQGGARVLRLGEDFSSINGPDLFVWLVRDGDARDYVDLGRLKGNRGAQNYAVPESVNLAEYSQVLIWCRAFRVLFGSAVLAGGAS